MKKNSRLLFILGFILIAQLSLGQGIGIGTTSPDPSAMLQIYSPSKNRGLIIPTFGIVKIPTIPTTAASDGVMFYDSGPGKICYFYGGSWHVLNPFDQGINLSPIEITPLASFTGSLSVTNSVSTNTITTNTVSNSGNVGTNTLSSNTIASGSITNSGNVGTNTLSSATITNSGNIGTSTLSSGTVSTNTLTVPGFANNALVPSGVIVMWSGATTNVPAGWVLCDGTYPAPDLRGLFIVGAGTPAYWVGRTGGEETHVLTEAEMPSHNHKIVGTSKGSNGGQGKPAVADIEDDEIGGFTEYTGGNVAHNNLPPFYALAYIYKL